MMKSFSGYVNEKELSPKMNEQLSIQCEWFDKSPTFGQQIIGNNILIMNVSGLYNH